jgi:hypothetical protein
MIAVNVILIVSLESVSAPDGSGILHTGIRDFQGR